MNFQGAKKYIIRRLAVELADNLYYHGLHHTLEVYEAVVKLAELEQLSEEEKIWVATAALYHDAGFIYKYEDNEKIGVKLTEEILPSFNYSDKAIKEISKIIMSTRLSSQPTSLLEKIMRDADVDYLGRTDVKEMAHLLFKELQEYKSPFSEIEWNRQQLKFLKEHRYYTKSAIDRRKANKIAYLQYLEFICEIQV